MQMRERDARRNEMNQGCPGDRRGALVRTQITVARFLWVRNHAPGRRISPGGERPTIQAPQKSGRLEFQVDLPTAAREVLSGEWNRRVRREFESVELSVRQPCGETIDTPAEDAALEGAVVQGYCRNDLPGSVAPGSALPSYVMLCEVATGRFRCADTSGVLSVRAAALGTRDRETSGNLMVPRFPSVRRACNQHKHQGQDKTNHAVRLIAAATSRQAKGRRNYA